ncbi:RNA polymerase sigma factor [Sporolactobacillus sp. THM19-2]|uniref:RNA polymerase sigma factor n=1 Tax=Sporolactobacillus sp. THM19-2 TaxID=2511171 RepID=UPI00101F1511|nr:hypothetical protein [Sporolactobacillus sp. THM19-2]RYL94453.1 hypothetical protein EWH91_00240 [Sporolactobacillus sp. THM19-2]
MMSDLELISLAQKKNRQAFAQLFRRYYAFLFHYLLKLIFDRETAEDIGRRTERMVNRSDGSFNGSPPERYPASWIKWHG